jgi:tripartite motif-containing protein 2/3/tripartite motif-containing protein 71
MEKQVTTIVKALTLLYARQGEISDQRAATAEDIHTTFRQLRDVLDARETELVGRLDRTAESKLKNLEVQKDQNETILAQLSSCLHFMKESLERGSKGGVVMMTTSTAKELTNPFTPDILEPNAKADMIFSASKDLAALCGNHGLLHLPIDPSKCYITGENATTTTVGEESIAILQAYNSEGKPCEETLESLECQIVSQISGTRARSCSVGRRGQSQYEIHYQPVMKGLHQLHIKADGQHIRGSPFSIAVRSSVEALANPPMAIFSGEEPWGIAINKMGEVVVTEWGGHSVSVFSPGGEKLRSFKVHGSPGRGSHCYPRGVAVDGEGNILVVCNEDGCIHLFTSEGQSIMSMDTASPNLFDVAVNAYNNSVYVVDTKNHCIRVLNFDLIPSTFGEEGKGEGQFLSPGCLACDSTGKVYVADQGNHRIQVFTAEGKFLSKFGRRGQGRGELDKPVGVAIDARDMVYISEWGNNRVSVFTSKGEFLTSFGKEGRGPGEFMCPRGLAVDDSGVVYVCDRDNNRIQLF